MDRQRRTTRTSRICAPLTNARESRRPDSVRAERALTAGHQPSTIGNPDNRQSAIINRHSAIQTIGNQQSAFSNLFYFSLVTHTFS
jgi:hypothetical protein